jgi:hypothetical protein
MIAEDHSLTVSMPKIEIPLGQCSETQSGRPAPVPHNFTA